MKSRQFALVCVLLFVNSTFVNAKVTQYVPSSINKQIELDIDRIMLSANMPALKRPLAVSKVEKALAKACSKNIILEACKSVNNWLYKLKSQGWTSSSQLNIKTSSGANQNFIENAKGEYLDSSWNAQYQVSGLINNYLAVSLGE